MGFYKMTKILINKEINITKDYVSVYKIIKQIFITLEEYFCLFKKKNYLIHNIINL